MSTKIARKIASRETKVVKRLKGKGSKGAMIFIWSVLMSPQTTKRHMFNNKKVILPKCVVIQSAVRSKIVLLASALALKLRNIFLRGSSFSPNNAFKNER